MLVLFDIDGTLISSGGAGARGMNRSFERLFKVSGALDGIPMAGRTDRAIAQEALKKVGQSADDEAVRRVHDAYCDDLQLALADGTSSDAGIMPGVASLLDALDGYGVHRMSADGRPVVVGLLTGNFVRGAQIKLGHFDLWRRFGFGAFGDHHTERRALVQVAVDAAAAAGHGHFEPERIVVIGDTPLDVDCAHAYGAKAIAVATGPYSREALAATGPAVAVNTLEELTIEALIGEG